MITSLLILAVSVVLLAYWFRYTCLLLIHADQDGCSIESVAEANSLLLPQVRAHLNSNASIDGLERALHQDYRILSYLLNHAEDLGISRLEQRMLAADFHLMRAWFAIASLLWPKAAREALGEMAAILTRMAGVIAERAQARM